MCLVTFYCLPCASNILRHSRAIDLNLLTKLINTDLDLIATPLREVFDTRVSCYETPWPLVKLLEVSREISDLSKDTAVKNSFEQLRHPLESREVSWTLVWRYALKYRKGIFFIAASCPWADRRGKSKFAVQTGRRSWQMFRNSASRLLRPTFIFRPGGWLF